MTKIAYATPEESARAIKPDTRTEAQKILHKLQAEQTHDFEMGHEVDNGAIALKLIEQNLELRKKLAAAQKDVKQLRQSRDKRNGKRAGIADLSVNVSVDSQKASQMLRFLDEFAKCAKAMERAASEAVNALNRMEENTELIKVEPPSVGSKSHPPGNDGVAHYPKGVWIDWRGGNEAPIPRGVLHKVKLRDASVSGGAFNASAWRWSHKGDDRDITAFMIL